LDGAARVRVASKAPGMLASKTRGRIFPSITKKPLEDDNLAGTICGARKENSLRTWASFALAASIFIWPAVAMTVLFARRITGIGGIFVVSKDPKNQRHCRLGIEISSRRTLFGEVPSRCPG